ncbi:MAG: hypothetical protein PsegKO_34810 [Pseudohongiellaceae bacterium]
MAKLQNQFDATQVEPQGDYSPLPAGTYRVAIRESEMRVTKNGQGQYLWLELEVLEGQQAGRKLYDRLNLVNNNPTAVEIAQRTLSAICHATGQMQVQDSCQLHDIPMRAKVKVEPAKGKYGESNSIRYLPLEQGGAPAAPAAPKPAPQPAAAPTPSSEPVAAQPAQQTPPWQRAGSEGA